MSNKFNYPFNPIPWHGSPHDHTGDNNLGVYTAETTQRYIPGTRYTTWDGRVFKYAKCGVAITNNKWGVKNLSVLAANKVAGTYTNAVTMTAAAVGDTAITVTFTAATLGDSTDQYFSTKNGVVAEDEFAGGYISLYTGNYRQNRMIVGNTASTGSSTSMILYLDAPLDHVLDATTPSYCEILANPYSHVGYEDHMYTSVMGVPCVTTTAGNYLWLQTWGILRITYHVLTSSEPPNQRQYVFNSSGLVFPALDDYGAEYQHAGFIIEGTPPTAAGSYAAAPFIMLQISI